MEWTTLCTGFADIADQEGFGDAANTLRRPADVEEWYERRYNKLIEAVHTNKVFKKPEGVLQKYRNRPLSRSILIGREEPIVRG